MSPRRSPSALRRVSGRASGSIGHRPTRGKTRALGQHFLRDGDVARRIVELAGPTLRDLVLEIGPGHGALTEALAPAGGRLIALEVDGDLAARLRQRLAGAGQVEILDADATVFDYGALPGLKPDPDGRVVVVGNLPYSVGTAILMALIEAGPGIDEMVLMLQKEVAERVAAPPGGKAYGSLSVLSQMACESRLAFVVPPDAFRPPPQVYSAVLHLRVRSAPPVPVSDPARFRTVVRAAFAQRRKSLSNALAAGLGLSTARARAALTAAGIDPMRRAETLTLAEFARLAEVVARAPG
jgi:16S rRNA (adenine1518-N6/adenine1519-N6)-dimethyltransferase